MGSILLEPTNITRSMAVSLGARFVWLKKGGYAIIDQALFAGSNFVVNIALARSLSPAEYGAFALAFAVLVLIGAVHSATITEPMMVFGPGKFSKGFRKYLAVLIWGHFSLTVPIGAGVFIIGAIISKTSNQSIGSALEGCGIAVPLVLFLWFARLAFYIKLQPAWSAVAASVYFVVMMSITWTLIHQHLLTPLTALIGIGVSGFSVALLFLTYLKPNMKGNQLPKAREVAFEHWQYGRWSTASVLTNWIPTNIYYLLMPIGFGLAGIANLRALINLMLPVQNCVAGLSMVLMPSLVHDLRASGTAGMNRTMTSHFSVLAAITVIYSGVLGISGNVVLRMLYGGKYDFLSRDMILLSGLLPLGGAIISILGNGLRALERPDLIFRCYLLSTIVTALIGIPLMVLWGIIGALLGMSLASAAAGASLFYFYRNVSSVGRG